MKRYWVNFDLETLMITNATQDLSKKGYTEVTEVEYDYWYRKFWEEIVHNT